VVHFASSLAVPGARRFYPLEKVQLERKLNMSHHRNERKLSFLVWSKHTPQEGTRIVPGFPNKIEETDWFQFTPFEAQVVAEACMQCNDRYSLNLADTLNKELHYLRQREAEGIVFP
jgi:hypothetical protein